MPLRNGARFEFKLQDCWIGAYWERNGPQFDLWICLVPMVPLHIRRFFPQKFPPPIEMTEEEWQDYRAAIDSCG